jgi:transcriptional regulator with XRE-family HTH domain
VSVRDLVVAPNRIAEERLASGVAEPAELARRADIDAAEYAHIEDGRMLPTKKQLMRICAALGGIPFDRLYDTPMLQLMGATAHSSASSIPTPRGNMEWVAGPMKLFVARDEITWMEEARDIPDEPVDAFFSLSCGTRATPHLLLDAIAAAKALGVRIVAASGPAGCCGKPYLSRGQVEAGEAFTLSKLRYAERIGATTTVMSCHACQQTAAVTTSRREIAGVSQPAMRQLWMGKFFAEKVAELGGRVPWKRRLSHRVLLDAHTRADTGVLSTLTEDMRGLLALIPGVVVVGELEGDLAAIRPCATRITAQPGRRPQWRPPEKEPREADARATRLGELVAARGADTVTSTHFSCHNMWSRYASDRMRVRHCVSLLAEALGVGHPDRAQAAAHLGDPVEIVRQTRAIWRTWDLNEAEALQLASDSIYPKDAGPIGCSCDEHSAQGLIPIDVLRGSSPGLTPVG